MQLFLQVRQMASTDSSVSTTAGRYVDFVVHAGFETAVKTINTPTRSASSMILQAGQL
jgi:hypothetical protein